MATLTGKTIASTYTSLLKLEGNSGSTIAGASGNAVQVKTGDDDATPLYLNTDRIGINTAAPSELLHLKSSTSSKPVLRIENANDDSQPPYINLVKSTTNESDNDFLGVIGFKGQNHTDEETEYAFISAQSTDVTDGTEDGKINFGTMKNGSGSGSAATINMVLNGANVGIGTTDPQYSLDVNKGSAGEIAAFRGNSDRGFVLASTDYIATMEHTTTNGNIKFNTSGSGNFYFTNSSTGGKVGIGTTAPNQNLTILQNGAAAVLELQNAMDHIGSSDTNVESGDVLGEIIFSGNDGNINSSGGGQADHSSIGARIRATADEGWGNDSNPSINNDNDSPTRLSFFTQSNGNTDHISTERMSISSNGNVGIGTTEPISPLHIKAGYNHIIDIINSTNPTYTISWTSADYNRIIVMIDVIGNDATTGGDPKGMRVSFSLEGDNFNPTNGASLMDPSDAADGLPLGAADDGGGLLFFECWGSDMDNYNDTDTNELDFTATIARDGSNNCVATLNFTDWAQVVGRMTVSSNVAAIVAKTA
tara:strand:+ start:1520 stop:3124 length:1605 start_codon:yes stop_codon:yes gene_type:complete